MSNWHGTLWQRGTSWLASWWWWCKTTPPTPEETWLCSISVADVLGYMRYKMKATAQMTVDQPCAFMEQPEDDESVMTNAGMGASLTLRRRTR